MIVDHPGLPHPRRRPHVERTRPTMKPVHLIRYGLPAAVWAAGVVVLVAGRGVIAMAAGIVLIGNAFMIFIVNLLARLTISSQDDRDREQRARETFRRTGHWPTPALRPHPRKGVRKHRRDNSHE